MTLGRAAIPRVPYRRHRRAKHTTDYLLLVFIPLFAGVIVVPIAARFGLGSILGFLLAGVALSPLLETLGVDVESVQHVAEFGVVMMLFLIGLELRPALLWRMRGDPMGLRTDVAGRSYRRAGAGALLHRHRAADAQREGLMQSDGG